MANNNVTPFPQVNWQAQCEALSVRLLQEEARYTNQDSVRIDQIDLVEQRNSDLQQRVALLESQNQELIRLQAEGAVTSQAESTMLKSRIEVLQVQADATSRATASSRRWRNSVFVLVPTVACATMAATFYFHAAIASLLP